MNRQTRRQFLKMAGLATASMVAPPLFASTNSRKKPNIIFILADDLGYGDLGCYGRKDIKTPAIDGIAAEGVKFTQYYSNGPECSPTRAAFLTGRYQHRVGGLECAIGNGNVGRYDDAIRLRQTSDLGLPVEEARFVLEERTKRLAVDADWQHAMSIGVTSVPTFAVGLTGVVGAQPYETLAQLMEQTGASKR